MTADARHAELADLPFHGEHRFRMARQTASTRDSARSHPATVPAVDPALCQQTNRHHRSVTIGDPGTNVASASSRWATVHGLDPLTPLTTRPIPETVRRQRERRDQRCLVRAQLARCKPGRTAATSNTIRIVAPPAALNITSHNAAGDATLANGDLTRNSQHRRRTSATASEVRRSLAGDAATPDRSSPIVGNVDKPTTRDHRWATVTFAGGPPSR